MKTKTYCVRVYPRYYEYDDIKAASPEEAEEKVLSLEWQDSEEVDHIEVMLQCEECGLISEAESTVCEDCGAEL